jgi:AraC-like DNA-binding protein
MQYLREQRMLAVRRELMDPKHNTSVTDIALKWGLNHLGRFSAYYSTQFGEMPSETLRMARLGTLSHGRAIAATATH